MYSNLSKIIFHTIILPFGSDHVIRECAVDLNPRIFDFFCEPIAEYSLYRVDQSPSHTRKILWLDPLADVLLTKIEKNFCQKLYVRTKYTKSLHNREHKIRWRIALIS